VSGRVIPHRLPSCPGFDSRFTIRHNPERDNAWWVYYEPPGANRIPADDAHSELIELVNGLKQAEGQSPGGSFSINEHGQVIARTSAPPGQGNAVHVIDVSGGAVTTYTTPILFNQGQLSPLATPDEGQPWPGPLCGMSYTFAKVGNPKPPSRNLDEVFVEEEGQILLLSTNAGIRPYPPTAGPLANFLAALRRQLPSGGRFRVNEHRRAFTSNGSVFIGVLPLENWFRPLTPRS
jgi:hypothetical protein